MRWLKHLMIDFDGVIYTYASGFKKWELPDPPMDGAVEAITHLVRSGFEYTVFTSRMSLTDDPPRMKALLLDWLAENGFPKPLDVTCEKRPALVYIDDRGRRFTDWPDVRKSYA